MLIDVKIEKTNFSQAKQNIGVREAFETLVRQIISNSPGAGSKGSGGVFRNQGMERYKVS